MMTKYAIKSARDVIHDANLDLDEDSMALLAPKQSPLEFLHALIDAGIYCDAVTYLACMLPMRKALWWGYQCAREQLQYDPTDRQKRTLETVMSWFGQSNDTNRRRVGDWADACNNETPAGFIATAVFFSEGSVADEDSSPAYPLPYAYAHAISGAVVSSAHLAEPDAEELQRRLQRFLHLGEQLLDQQIEVM
ncbi:MAG TPA: hypothetical protein ENG78_01130 [Acidiferrobacteraceae bacterium]|nr:hypothetical protein [Acidiferrobacteraceae bacterium]HEX19420.1 hypothetical protein [Acidiferrobacteraceae bacterium]